MKQEKILIRLSEWLSQFIDHKLDFSKGQFESQFKSELKKMSIFGSRDRKILYSLFYSYFRHKGLITKSTFDFLLSLAKMESIDIPTIKNPEFYPFNIFPYLDARIDLNNFTESLLRRPYVFFRLIKPEKLSNLMDDFAVKKYQFGTHIFYFIEEENKKLQEYIHEGIIEIQDISSQAIGLNVLKHHPGYLWDACAGAGGKSLQIALNDPTIQIEASDLRDYKFKEIINRAVRTGLKQLRVTKHDATINSFSKDFDHILIDAPCSCSGVWARNPVLKWEFNELYLNDLLDLQAQILQNTTKNLIIGGYLTYATCSVFRNENDLQIQNFLNQNNNYKLVMPETELPHIQTEYGILINGFELKSDFSYLSQIQRMY